MSSCCDEPGSDSDGPSSEQCNRSQCSLHSENTIAYSPDWPDELSASGQQSQTGSGDEAAVSETDDVAAVVAAEAAPCDACLAVVVYEPPPNNVPLGLDDTIPHSPVLPIDVFSRPWPDGQVGPWAATMLSGDPMIQHHPDTGDYVDGYNGNGDGVQHHHHHHHYVYSHHFHHAHNPSDDSYSPSDAGDDADDVDYQPYPHLHLGPLGPTSDDDDDNKNPAPPPGPPCKKARRQDFRSNDPQKELENEQQDARFLHLQHAIQDSLVQCCLSDEIAAGAGDGGDEFDMSGDADTSDAAIFPGLAAGHHYGGDLGTSDSESESDSD